jgi:hypothetical protein
MDDLQRLTEIIRTARWVDGMKNAGVVTDKALAERILEDGFVHPDNIGDTMWINAFSCIRPKDELLTEVGRDLIQNVAKIPGTTLVKVSIT